MAISSLQPLRSYVTPILYAAARRKASTLDVIRWKNAYKSDLIQPQSNLRRISRAVCAFMKMVAGRLIFSAAAVACLLAGTPAAMDVGRAGSVSPSSQVSEGARTVLPRSSSSETSKGSSSTSSSSSACEQDIVECGVSLTSISNWCVGECGTRVTTDPRVFAQNYPTDPNEEAHRACVNFIMAIPYMLPCAYVLSLSLFLPRVRSAGRAGPAAGGRGGGGGGGGDWGIGSLAT